MPDGTTDRLKRNIVTRREFERIVRYWCDEIGFVHPWTAHCQFHDSSKGDLPDERDSFVYCAIIAQPQYHRVFVHTDLRHAGWNTERCIQNTVRHELYHAFVSLYTQAVSHLVKDPRIAAILDDLEDELVNRLAASPLLRHVPNA